MVKVKRELEMEEVMIGWLATWFRTRAPAPALHERTPNPALP